MLGAVLFSTFRGLFVWHPIFFFAAIGLLVLARKDRTLALGLIASWWNWWQGSAFGGRMFLSAMWIWVWGLTACFDWLSSHRRLIPLITLFTVLLILWNGLTLLQYRLLFIPAEQPLTWQQLTLDKFTMLVTLARKLFARL
jgi:hypothetical protein